MAIESSKNQLYNEKESVITVSNENFSRFKSFAIRRSIDDICGSFNIVISRPEDNPFKNNTVINIVLDGRQFMKGIIYGVRLTGDAKTDDIVISGRDITGDLIDSMVPDDAKVYKAGANIINIAQKIIDSLGLDIKVVNNTGDPIEDFSEEEIISCETGQTAIDFLEQYSRKRQLFINTSVGGALEFFKANGVNVGNRIINQKGNNNNNVIKWDTKYNTSERYGTYICKSQKESSSGSVDDFAGTAVDEESRSSRIFEFISEESSNQSECDERAEEESNVRRARSFEYEATVQAFGDNNDWTINQLVSVDDEFADVHGEFLIKAVEYNLDINKGRTTAVMLTHKDAYTVQASISARESKTSNAGAGW